MQILIATQGVTPNSVEINTNCVLPGNCSLSDLPSLARRFYITSAPRGTFTYSLLPPLASQPSLPFSYHFFANRAKYHRDWHDRTFVVLRTWLLKNYYGIRRGIIMNSRFDLSSSHKFVFH